MDFKIVNNDTLKVHWYSAESKDLIPTAAIAFFFGGGWRGGEYTHFQRQALYFSQRGLTTFLFEYRVENRHNTSPVECIKDARSALRFLKLNHSKFNIDPQKIIASGGSAGGHIAAATATLHSINELTDDVVYYVIKVDANNISLSDTPTGALSNIKLGISSTPASNIQFSLELEKSPQLKMRFKESSGVAVTKNILLY